jgi:hypothetical protein
VQLGLYPTGTQQSREVAIVPDMDGNNSFEIIMGGKEGNVALLSGGTLATSVGENSNQFPDKFELGQNYPNPFNPSTTINISLPVLSDFTMTIYDLLGKEVKSFVFERVPAGVHSAVWDGKDNVGTAVSTGVYFYRLNASSFSSTRKAVLIR